MPALTIQNVFYSINYDQTRQSRPATPTGGFELLSEHTALVETGHVYTLDPSHLKPILTPGNVTYYFSFVNVTGLIGGPLTVFTHNAPPKSGKIGTAHVMVRVVYIAGAGFFSDGPGAFIDAFHENTGSLVNNYFVTVTPDSIGATTEANVSGFVGDQNIDDPNGPPTTITAYPHITHSSDILNSVNASFVGWHNLDNSKPVLSPGEKFVMQVNQRSLALAFYRTPTLERVPIRL